MGFFENRYRTILLILMLFVGASQPEASLLETTRNKAFFKLQPYKEEMSANYERSPYKSASLININSNVNVSYLLSVRDNRGAEKTYSILSVDDKLRLRLDEVAPELFISDNGKGHICNIQEEIAAEYKKHKRSKLTHIPVCNNLLFVVIKQDGYQSRVEKGAEFLRWLGGDAGENVINEVKEGYFKDKYVVMEQAQESTEISAVTENNSVLPRADIEARYQNSSIPTRHLGLKTQNSEKSLLAGKWYPLKNYPGVYAGMIMPGMVSRKIQKTHRDRVNTLDSVERKAVVYLVSFSLSKYTLGWGHGTDHPGVGWSRRAVRISKDNPYGPDGFNKIKPLIPLGHTPPYLWSKIIGTFSGGFQKRHGAFRYGELSMTNKAHHYGFMENGVMLTSPTEGLASVIMYRDGNLELKRWTAQDNEKLPLIRHIRQNGVPLVHRDEGGQGIPGKWVRHWSAGNWSGSAKKQLRTPRGAACLIETPEDNFLVYAYFSGATPSAMARVFQAYGCNAAIHLDMNSPGQAYASLFTPQDGGGSIDIELLTAKMYQYMGGKKDSPRFFIKPDYKDFFYIMKRE